MWLRSGKVSLLLACIPQQKAERETHRRARNFLLIGQLLRNVGEPNSRSCTVTQRELHLPYPTQLALPSGPPSLLNRPLSIFLFSAESSGRPWVCIESEQKKKKSLMSRKSLCIDGMFLSLLFTPASFSLSHWFNKWSLQRTSSLLFTAQLQSLPASQPDQSSTATAPFSALRSLTILGLLELLQLEKTIKII